MLRKAFFEDFLRLSRLSCRKCGCVLITQISELKGSSTWSFEGFATTHGNKSGLMIGSTSAVGMLDDGVPLLEPKKRLTTIKGMENQYQII